MKFALIAVFTSVLTVAPCAFADTESGNPLHYLETLDGYAHLSRIAEPSSQMVRDYLVPLGAIEKIRGVWSPRDSERVSGALSRYTWQVLDGFTSAEMLDELEAMLVGDQQATLRFGCEARGCGSSVQWANRIFRERLLYGTEASQRYRVYAISLPTADYRLLVYASYRSSDRQYLHAQLLEITPAAAGGS